MTLFEATVFIDDGYSINGNVTRWCYAHDIDTAKDYIENYYCSQYDTVGKVINIKKVKEPMIFTKNNE